MVGRIGIDDVAPVVSGGRFPAKAVVGEIVPVRATVWREGHDAVAATLVVRYHGSAYPQLVNGPAGRGARDVGGGADRDRRQSTLSHHTATICRWKTGTTPDVFHGQFTPDSVGLWTYRVDAWGDPIATWRKAVDSQAGRWARARTNCPTIYWSGRGCSNGPRRGCRASCATRSSRRRSRCESPATRSPGPGQRCRAK